MDCIVDYSFNIFSPFYGGSYGVHPSFVTQHCGKQATPKSLSLRPFWEKGIALLGIQV